MNTYSIESIQVYGNYITGHLVHVHIRTLYSHYMYMIVHVLHKIYPDGTINTNIPFCGFYIYKENVLHRYNVRSLD